jgi:FMN phosphatase YigB (HAD superfamily)
MTELIPKKLYVFDFDDTLVRDNANIYLVKKDGSKVVITPSEYHNVHLQDEETIDVEEFDDVTNPYVFEEMMALLKKHEKDAAILTARSNGTTVQKYLLDLGIDVPVFAVGVMSPTKNAIGVNAKKKAAWISRVVSAMGLTYVEFWDDNKANIEEFEKLKALYPETKFVSHLVKH